MAVKKIWLSFIALLLGLSVSFLCIGGVRVYNAAYVFSTNKKLFIIDAGHGGFDGGATVREVLEKDLNLSISLYLKDLLSLSGYDIIMIRTTDCAINTEGNNIRTKKISDMKNRLKIMQNYPEAKFISIHLNKYDEEYVKGLQVFYSPNNDESLALAQSIQSSVKSVLQPNNKRKVKKATKDTFLLYNAPIPAVIVECGFLSNNEDFNNLINQNYQKKIALAIFGGIIANNNI